MNDLNENHAVTDAVFGLGETNDAKTGATGERYGKVPMDLDWTAEIEKSK